jgi:hypothetical protein
VYYRWTDLCGRKKEKARRRPSNRIWRARFGAAAADSPAFSNFLPNGSRRIDRLGAARWQGGCEELGSVMRERGLKFERQTRAALFRRGAGARARKPASS